MAIRLIRHISLTISIALSACASSGPTLDTPVSFDRDIQLRMRLSNVGPAWRMETDRTMLELTQQRPVGLDAPLRILSGPLPPGPPVGSEVSVRFGITGEGAIYRLQLLQGGLTPASGLSSGDLGNAIIRAIARWRFAPPLHQGLPTNACCIKITFD
jgi:hypothetical protein